MSASFLSFVLAGIALAAVFALAWWHGRRIGNFGVVDVVWAYAFAPLAVVFAWAGAGWPARRAVFALMIIAWSLRLGTHLYRRVRRLHPVEDARYAALRGQWGEALDRKMALFFQGQAASVALLLLPFWAVWQHRAPSWQVWEGLGILLWFGAWIGEATADAQLAAFNREPQNRGRVCAAGLWRYSRHPNYFFEWCTWVAFAVFALGSPLGWLGLTAPMLMLYLLLRVTGIPATETQSLKSRGDAYRRYQQTTSAFVPWFRKPSNPLLP